MMWITYYKEASSFIC